MATYRAIGATCEAVLQLLQRSWQPDMFDGNSLQFALYRTRDFGQPMDVGVSLFLYRVAVNSIQRTPAGRPGPGGHPRRSQLPLDLHILLTPWAKDASLEQVLLGWLMRTLEDTPILPAGLLNTLSQGIFEAEETVEVVPGQMSNEEMFRIWDVLPNDYQISIPYVARVVRIDSQLEQGTDNPVLLRELNVGVLKDL